MPITRERDGHECPSCLAAIVTGAAAIRSNNIRRLRMGSQSSKKISAGRQTTTPGKNDRTVLCKAQQRRVLGGLLQKPQPERADGIGEQANGKKLPSGAKHLVPLVALPIGLHVKVGVECPGQETGLRCIPGAVVQMHDDLEGAVQRAFFGTVQDITCDVRGQAAGADWGRVERVEGLRQRGKAQADRVSAGRRPGQGGLCHRWDRTCHAPGRAVRASPHPTDLPEAPAHPARFRAWAPGPSGCRSSRHPG